MYATVVRCDMQAIACAAERGRLGRALATRLGALPGFVAFVAFDVDADAGCIVALCIFDDRIGLAAADGVIAQWQREDPTGAGAGIRRIETGAVIAQKGL